MSHSPRLFNLSSYHEAWRFLAPFFFLSLPLHAERGTPGIEQEFDVWMTGPLLAPSANVIKEGHYNIEPYIFVTAVTGRYNRDWDAVDASSLSVNTQYPVQIGITSYLDFQFSPNYFLNVNNGQTNLAVGDTFCAFDVQLLQDKFILNDWTPSIRFSIQETFPTGKYRELDAGQQGTDIGGVGAYQTGFALTISKMIAIYGVHFLNTRLALSTTLPTPVSVRGLNAYGGGAGTRGTIYPPITLDVDIGLEYSLTRNWVLANDFAFTWGTRTRFKGDPGINPDGSPAVMTRGSSAQYSMAPAIEYNWSENVGAIAGCWFTLAGREASRFASTVIAVNFYY
jgi:hypothetical protein